MGRVDLNPKRGIDFERLMRDVLPTDEPEKGTPDLASRLGEAVLQGVLRRASEGEFGASSGTDESSPIDRLVVAANKLRAMDIREREYQDEKERRLQEQAERLRKELIEARQESGGSTLEMMKLLMEQQQKNFEQTLNLMRENDERRREELREIKEEVRGRKSQPSEEEGFLRKMGEEAVLARLNADPRQEFLKEREFWQSLLGSREPAVDPAILEIQLKHDIEKARLQYEYERRDRELGRSEDMREIIREAIRQIPAWTGRGGGQGGPAGPQAQQAAQAPPEPAFRIECGECGNKFVMRNPGPIVRCPKCGEPIKLEEEEDGSEQETPGAGTPPAPVTGGRDVAQNPATGGPSPNGRKEGAYRSQAPTAVRHGAPGVPAADHVPGREGGA